jgi:hypothetical protein
VRTLALLLLLVAAPLLWAEPPRIVGETTVAPYRIVRLGVENLPAKAGLRWKVRPVGADPKAPPFIDWATGKNVQKPEWTAPPGRYEVTLTVVTIDPAGVPAIDDAETVVTIGTPPPPAPPGPTPPGPVPPGPTPDIPAPIPLPGLRVLVVEETGDRSSLTAGQREVLFGATVRDYLRSKCVTNPQNPDGAFRIWDKDQNPAGDPDAAVWGAALGRPRTATPWVIVSNGRTGYEGPLPADVTGAKFVELLKRYEN